MPAKKVTSDVVVHKHQVDDEFGKAFLDDLQKGVWSGGALVLRKSCLCVYYKHGRELRLSTVFSPVEPKVCVREKKAFWKRRCVADDIAPHVVNAYMSKRALWKARCKRATSRRPEVLAASMESDSQTAWKLRLQESRAFLESLVSTSSAHDASCQRRARVRVSSPVVGKICETSDDARIFALASSSERNFRRASRVRRNGVSVIGSVHGRMPCEKRRLLQRAENAEEHNAANIIEVLRSLSQSYRDYLFLMVGLRCPGPLAPIYGEND